MQLLKTTNANAMQPLYTAQLRRSVYHAVSSENSVLNALRHLVLLAMINSMLMVLTVKLVTRPVLLVQLVHVSVSLLTYNLMDQNVLV
jgi:hypothetical protein